MRRTPRRRRSPAILLPCPPSAPGCTGDPAAGGSDSVRMNTRRWIPAPRSECRASVCVFAAVLCARDGVRATTFLRMRAHAFSTPAASMHHRHRDGRRSVRTVRGGVSGGSPSLRSFAQSGLCGAGYPGFARSAPTVGVHLRGHAGDARDMRRCVSIRSGGSTSTLHKTPCFTCFFEQGECRACVTRCIRVTPVRNIRPRHRDAAPANGRGKHDKGVDS